MAAPPENKPGNQPPSVRYATTRSQDRRSPAVSHGKATAQAVLAEVSSVLKSHWDPIKPKLETDFTEETKRVLLKLGIKNVSDATVSVIAKEAVDTSLDALSTVQSSEQIGQALADGLSRSISANIPDPDLRQDKIYEEVLPETEAIKTENTAALENTASLGNAILTITTSPTIPIIAEHINQTVEEQIAQVAPLASEQEIANTQKSIDTYTQNYQQTFTDEILTSLDSKKTPSLEQIQTAKEKAHTQAIESVPAQTDPKNPIDPKTIATVVATSVGLKPLDARSAEEAGLGIAQPGTFTFSDAAKTEGLGVGVAIATIPKVQASSFNALLTNSSDFKDDLLSLTKKLQELEQAKKTRTLSRQEKSQRKTIEQKVKIFSKAIEDERKNPKKIKTLRSFFQDLKSGNRLVWASNKTQEITNIYGGEYADISSYILKEGRPSSSFIYQRFKPGIDKLALRFAPQAFLANPTLLAGKARGSLGIGLGGLPVGNLSSILKNAFSKQALAGGMGMNPSIGFAKKLAKVLGALFGGIGAYFLALGQAAFTGFLIGAGIGATGGAIFGAALPVAMLGPAGVLLWPVTIPLGAFAGGIVGGIAGGLIALGLASGSATMVSTGVGAGLGGVIGGYVGFLLGSAISGAFITFAAAACAATLVGCVLVPIAAVSAPVITLTFTALGALAGAAIGGFAGYLIGNYLINPISNFFGAVGDGFGGFFGGATGGISTGGGFLGSILGNGIGLVNAGWNGLVAGAGGLWGGVTSGVGWLTNGISTVASAAIPSTAVTGAFVGGSVAGIGIIGVTTILVTSAAFFSAESAAQNHIAGENQYFTVNKTADKTSLPNSASPQDLTFTITITAKALKLTSVQVTDEMNYQNKDTSTPVPNDKSGQPITPIASCQNDLEPNATCTAVITISVTDAFKDSVIVNTVKVKATPEGKDPVSDSKTATVTVGNPPASCPRGWPTTGTVTQGPEGATSHGGPFDPTNGHLDLEAIDIGTPKGSQVYSTIDAIVTGTPSDGPDNQIIDAKPIGCAGLTTIRYQHLSKIDVRVGDKITFGQPIGKTGVAGTGPHMHYQFNATSQRNFKLETPNIPKNILRTCDGAGQCATTITSAPL
jgi:murein DD-endopeptidase MepM/ murein hydrolase activator NlpD